MRSALASVLLLLLLLPSVALADLSTFQSALDTHIKAIESRNLRSLASTLTSGPNLTFIALNGTATTSRQEYMMSMQVWLSDADWSWKLAPIAQNADSQVGVAVYRVAYQDRDAQGKPVSLDYILSLVFAKQGSEWRLVHDQNTRIAPN